MDHGMQAMRDAQAASDRAREAQQRAIDNARRDAELHTRISIENANRNVREAQSRSSGGSFLGTLVGLIVFVAAAAIIVVVFILLISHSGI